MPQCLGRLILLVIIELLKRLIAGELDEHSASLHKISLQILRTIYRGDHATPMLFDQI